MSALLVDLGATAPVGIAVVGGPVQSPQPPPARGQEFGKASPIALVVIVLLALATVLLIRSMSKHLRRVPATFDPPSTDGPLRADGPLPAGGPMPADGTAPGEGNASERTTSDPVARTRPGAAPSTSEREPTG